MCVVRSAGGVENEIAPSGRICVGVAGFIFYGKVHISFNVLCSQLAGDSLQSTPMQEVIHIQSTISCIKLSLKKKIL